MILVTGATGFVGAAVVRRLAADDQLRPVAVAVRSNACTWPANVIPRQVADLSLTTDWSAALAGVSVVVHAAARVHVMMDASSEPLAEFRRVNVQGT